KYFSYNRIRDAQWNALGNVPEGAKMEVEGMVVYSRPGFKFIPTEYNPVRAEGFTSAKLRVEYATMRHPLGLGDVRLNFKLGDSPSNGAFLRLRGTVTTGPFKELMLNVYEIESLGDPEQLPNN
ncbi:MAG: hypothetical protein KAG97_12690, partial [Victivallales bacterium]|nr:hypothetical protein [Victivallales bacterium]